MMHFPQMELEFKSLESGIPRLNGIRSAIAEADEQKDLFWQFRFRFDYLKESIFCGDRYFAMIIFPQLLALYDEHEALRDNEECDYNMLVAFKWIVEAAPEFPQISKTEIDSYFRLFKRRLLEHGCSLSIYYMKRSLFYMHCDRGIAAADFYRFLDAPLDFISDGRALYYDQQVKYYISIGDEEKALQAAKLIFSGELVSNALPQATYHEFIRYYLNLGRYEDAMYYARMTEKRVKKDPYYLDITGTLLALYGITQPEQGIRLFCENEPIYRQSKNPFLRMLFAIGAYHLFREITDVPTLSVDKESEIYPLAQSQDLAGIAQYYYDAAAELAGRFDQRNGTDDFMILLNLCYPEYRKNESE